MTSICIPSLTSCAVAMYDVAIGITYYVNTMAALLVLMNVTIKGTMRQYGSRAILIISLAVKS